jgi:hypothetical protein
MTTTATILVLPWLAPAQQQQQQQQQQEQQQEEVALAPSPMQWCAVPWQASESCAKRKSWATTSSFTP